MENDENRICIRAPYLVSLKLSDGVKGGSMTGFDLEIVKEYG